MQAREYLLQIKANRNKISSKRERINYLKELAIIPASPTCGERVKTSKDRGSTLEKVVCKYVDNEAELLTFINECMRIEAEIIKTLEKLSADEYMVLYDKYVLDKSYQEIADLRQKSYSYVTKVHGTGLQNIQNILDSSVI